MYPRWMTSVAFGLLLVFVFNTCLFGVALSVILHLHKTEAHTSLHQPSKEVMELRISADVIEHPSAVFHWEKEWEFEYRGEMYDVVDSRKEGDVYVYACKHDSREEILKKRADREAKRNTDNRDTQSKKHLKLGGEYLPVTHAPAFPVVHELIHGWKTILVSSVSQREVPDPPPWVV